MSQEDSIMTEVDVEAPVVAVASASNAKGKGEAIQANETEVDLLPW